jgi:hypothetical protein
MELIVMLGAVAAWILTFVLIWRFVRAVETIAAAMQQQSYETARAYRTSIGVQKREGNP